jgi:hypothetical protein
MVRRATPALLLLAACAGDGSVTVSSDDFELGLVPRAVGTDPFEGTADLTVELRDASGTTQWALGGSADATWTVPEFPPLSDATLRLLVTEPGATTDPLDLAGLRASGTVGPLTLSEGTREVIVTLLPYGGVAEAGTLGDVQISFGPAVATLSNGKTYLFGGSSSVLGAFGDAASQHILSMDPTDATLAFTRAGTIPDLPNSNQERVLATATVVVHEGIEQILVVGGRRTWAPATIASGQAFLWNPETDERSWDGIAPEDRSEHQAVTRSDGRVFVLGGYDELGEATFLTYDVWQPGDSPAFTAGGIGDGIGDIGFGIADLGEDGLILCGGATNRVNRELLEPTDQCRRLRDDGTVNLLPELAKDLGVAQPNRLWHAMAPTADGRVLVTGGVADAVGLNAASAAATRSAWLLDPTPGAFRWEALPDMNEARAMHRALPLPDGRVLLLGGVDAVVGTGTTTLGNAPACGELYDPDSRTFTLLTDCPAAATGAWPAVGLADGFGATVVAGLRTDGGGNAFAFVGAAP